MQSLRKLVLALQKLGLGDGLDIFAVVCEPQCPCFGRLVTEIETKSERASVQEEE